MAGKEAGESVGDGGGVLRVQERVRPGRSSGSALGSHCSSSFCRSANIAGPRFFADRARPSLTILEHTVNGQPGLVAQLDGVTVAVYAFGIAGDRITHIWAILNSDKLRPWTTG